MAAFAVRYYGGRLAASGWRGLRMRGAAAGDGFGSSLPLPSEFNEPRRLLDETDLFGLMPQASLPPPAGAIPVWRPAGVTVPLSASGPTGRTVGVGMGG